MAGAVRPQGGWPKEVDVNEIESTIRYRKKVRASARPRAGGL